MEIPKPENGKITIYSKSGCPNCTKAKNLLKQKQKDYIIIDCDEFILEDKEELLKFMYSLIGKEWKTFPMIFDENNFIGGYVEIEKYINNSLDFNTEF